MAPTSTSRLDLDPPIGGGAEGKRLYDAADAELPAIADAALAVVARLQTVATARLVMGAVDEGDPRALRNALVDAALAMSADTARVVKAEGDDLVQTILQAMGRAAVASQLPFNLVDPIAVDAARRSAAAFVTGIGTQAARSVTDAVTLGLRTELSRPSVERLIRSSVGMSRPQTRALANLLAAMDAATAYDSIGDMPGPERAAIRQVRSYRLLERGDRARIRPGMTGAQASKIADRYEAKAIRHRAETIARTETMRAANAGKIEGMRLANRDGVIGTIEKVWVAGIDDRTCLRCNSLHGTVVGIDAQYEETGAGLGPTAIKTQVDVPPLHARCRCTITFRVGSGPVPPQSTATAPSSTPPGPTPSGRPLGADGRPVAVEDPGAALFTRTADGYPDAPVPASRLSGPEVFKRDAVDQLDWETNVKVAKLADARRTGLYDEIAADGVQLPVQVFVPRKGLPEVSSGHHRIAVAEALGQDVPVRWYGPGYFDATGKKWSMEPRAYKALERSLRNAAERRSAPLVPTQPEVSAGALGGGSKPGNIRLWSGNNLDSLDEADDLRQYRANAPALRETVEARPSFNPSGLDAGDVFEDDVVGMYTSGGHQPINQRLRYGGTSDAGPQYSDEALDEASEILARTIGRHETPDDVLTYRGMSGADFDGPLARNDWLQDKGFASTSTEREVAEGFAGADPWIMEIQVPKGTNALYIGGDEGELLMQRGTWFRVKKVDEATRTVTVKAVM